MPLPIDGGEQKTVIIVGAGLAGAMMASFISRMGHKVEVYERRGDPRAKGFIGGRSINLALSCRGLTALKELHLDQAIVDQGCPMRGRMMHDPQGRLTFQPYSKNRSDAINSVSRGDLNLTLIEHADREDLVTFHFSQKCVDVDLDTATVKFEHDKSGETSTIKGDLVIGADGAFSAVRATMQQQPDFEYDLSTLEHGYKELTIPPTDAGEFAMDPEALHIWPRGGFMMIALPNRDMSFTCTCFWPHKGPNSFAAIKERKDILPFFEGHFADAVPLMPTLEDDFEKNPIGSLATIRCAPWHHNSGGRGKVVLIGDAAHAIVPFYGQGINAGFEDARILNGLLREHADDWATALSTFSAQRKPHAEAIADLALENFIEMRDKVGSSAFLLKKKVEKTVHRLFPGWFTPLYNLVSFSNVPYADARDEAHTRWNTVLFTGLGLSIGLIVILVALIALLVLGGGQSAS